MAKVTITKTSTNTKLWGSGTHTWTYTLNNFTLFDVDLISPVSLYALPENEAQQAILMKIIGNEMRINIGWVIKDEPSNTATGIVSDTKTPIQQVGFLTNEFQPNGLQDTYTITIVGTGFTKTVLVESIKCHTDDTITPTWTGTLTGVVGNVLTAYNSDAPRPPTGLLATRVTATQYTLTWSAPGSSPVPTKYTVEYKPETGDWQLLSSSVTSPQTIVGALNSKYRYRVRSQLTTGSPAGYPSDAILVTFV